MENVIENDNHSSSYFSQLSIRAHHYFFAITERVQNGISSALIQTNGVAGSFHGLYLNCVIQVLVDSL